MSQTKFDAWLYCHENCEEAFSMVTSDLLESEQFQGLSQAARIFYIVLATHKRTTIQKQCLYMSLTKYHKLQGDNWTKEEIKLESGQGIKKGKPIPPYFVIPEKHLKEYGYKSSYATKLKNELIQKGFIETFAFEKGKDGYSNYNCKTPTIYKFVNKWKK